MIELLNEKFIMGDVERERARLAVEQVEKGAWLSQVKAAEAKRQHVPLGLSSVTVVSSGTLDDLAGHDKPKDEGDLAAASRGGSHVRPGPAGKPDGAFPAPPGVKRK